MTARIRPTAVTICSSSFTTLWSADNQIGALVDRPNTVLANGVFSVVLDFGATAFNNPASIFIEIAVKPNGSPNAYTILGPRQQLTVVPYAVRATNATNADLATNAVHATNADLAANATNAVNANHSASTDIATFAYDATNAVNATNSTTAATATNALNLGGNCSHRLCSTQILRSISVIRTVSGESYDLPEIFVNSSG